MKTKSALSKTDLDNLLAWLSADFEEAGRRYVEVREGLARYFRVKGCYEAESLADETMNRVALKLKSMDIPKDLRPGALFHGFAKKIFLEYLAGLKTAPMQLDLAIATKHDASPYAEGEEKERRFVCLEDCMARLKKDESHMMTVYFAKEKRDKIDSRRHLAESLNLTMGNLHIRVYRIKQVLRECVENCIRAAGM